MPTASTSQILGNYESFEPATSNLYARKTLAGTFTVINRYLVADLERLGLWNESMKNQILADNGSIQRIDSIPGDLKQLYRTVWEIRQRVIIDMAADRAPFIDQSQSMNIYMGEPTFAQLTSCHFYAWQKGLKTACYYLKTNPAMDPTKVGIRKPTQTAPVCSRDNPDGCIPCGA